MGAGAGRVLFDDGENSHPHSPPSETGQEPTSPWAAVWPALPEKAGRSDSPIAPQALVHELMEAVDVSAGLQAYPEDPCLPIDLVDPFVRAWLCAALQDPVLEFATRVISQRYVAAASISSHLEPALDEWTEVFRTEA